MTQVASRLTSPESVGMSAERLERIAPALQKYVDERGYPGFTTLVSRRGQLVHAGRIGWQDREAEVPLAEDTIYRLYSMTKPIVCTALMTLFEEGQLPARRPGRQVASRRSARRRSPDRAGRSRTSRRCARCRSAT